MSFLFISIDKDWEDIKFGVDNQVDFYAVSFVKDAKVVHELEDYLKSNFLLNFFSNFLLNFFLCRLQNFNYFYFICFVPSIIKLLQTSNLGCNADIHVIVKIESADSIPNLHSIISASDGVSFNILCGPCNFFLISIEVLW